MMKYNEKEFSNAVSEYKKLFSKSKAKNVFITFDVKNKEAFYSLAPLSRALHELNIDMSCVATKKKLESVEALGDFWQLFEDMKSCKKNSMTDALKDFVEEVDKKMNGEFAKMCEKPEIILGADSKSFNGTMNVPFNTKWFKDYRMQELLQTADILWRDVYNLKKNERAAVGFPLIPTEKMIGHPLEDFLDGYSIAWAMAQSAAKTAEPILGSSTFRESQKERAEKASDLRSTLLGCELEKDIDEEPFIKFSKLSKLLKLDRFKPIDLSFSVAPSGYPGKHMFGERIGYPSKNKKTRWLTPGQMIYKFDFYPQTKDDDRDPLARTAFTETIPIDIFIETNLVDWSDIRGRNQKLKEAMDKCDVIHVQGKLNEKYVTKLEVGLIMPNGQRRWVRRSDTDVREKINKEYLKMTGIKAGCMGNIPGGEAFVTPEYIKGIFVGDVVIHVDKSYALDEKDPFVVECYGNTYKVLTAPKKILSEFNKRKKESYDILLEAEKHKSLPQEIIDLKKRNFEGVGEFAINTNPKARLCDYLIVNEKIAKMMHIALGSGYEPDRSTEYHMDIVFNAPRQKLDVFGTNKKGGKVWILKGGEFVL
jgi:hypothetical protein